MKTKRVLLLLGVMWVPGALNAQTLVSPAFQQGDSKEVKAERPRKVIRFRAAGQPDPSLRYRFWPAPEMRVDENPMPFVSRAIMLGLQETNDKERRRQFMDDYEKFAEMSLDELPADELRGFLNDFGEPSLGELERCENLMNPSYDLGIETLSASEMVATLLPEFQESRQLARILHLRIRLAVAEERWDDAVRDIRIGFRLADIIGHTTDFLIARLVGFAISGMMLDAAEEALQQPHCPNLYWALASLPESQLFETRSAIEFESVLVSRLVTKWPPLPEHEIGAQAARHRIRVLADEANETMSFSADFGQEGAMFLSGLYVVTMADESRRVLAESTDWGERAYTLSAPEAVLRATYLSFARSRDEWVKWSLLPRELWDEYEQEREQAVNQNEGKRDVLSVMVNMLTPALDAARRAGDRTLQKRNFVISLEALRMYAAEYGELPQTLEKLRPVPAWSDGLSRKPFVYQRTTPSRATIVRAERYPGDKETTVDIVLEKGN